MEEKQLEEDIQVALTWFQFIPETERGNDDWESFKRLYKEFTEGDVE